MFTISLKGEVNKFALVCHYTEMGVPGITMFAQTSTADCLTIRACALFLLLP